MFVANFELNRIPAIWGIGGRVEGPAPFHFHPAQIRPPSLRRRPLKCKIAVWSHKNHNEARSHRLSAGRTANGVFAVFEVKHSLARSNRLVSKPVSQRRLIEFDANGITWAADWVLLPVPPPLDSPRIPRESMTPWAPGTLPVPAFPDPLSLRSRVIRNASRLFERVKLGSGLGRTVATMEERTWRKQRDECTARMEQRAPGCSNRGHSSNYSQRKGYSRDYGPLDTS